MPLSAVVMRAILAAGEQIGISKSKVLMATGLMAADVNDASFLLGDHEVRRVLEKLVVEDGQPMLGLRLAQLCCESSLHFFGQILLASPTLLHAAKVLQEMGPSTIGEPSVSLVANEREIRLELPATPHTIESAFMAEFLLCLLCRMALRFAGTSKQLVREVQFAHAKPYLAASLTTFGVAVSFDHQVPALIVDPALLQRSVPGTDPQAELVMRRIAYQEFVEPRHNKNWTGRVNAAIRRCPELAHVDFSLIARELGLSVRTLRRRVHAEGATLTELLDRLRAERAAHRLESLDDSIKIVAGKLGYTEASSFHRAFKRWTGVSPSEYRRRVRHDAKSH